VVVIDGKPAGIVTRQDLLGFLAARSQSSNHDQHRDRQRDDGHRDATGSE
jgi:hypothetical protein